MKGLKRFVSMVLLFCIMISLLPPMQFTRAAEVVRRYELDTDGIDVGADYLIVNSASNGTRYALRFNYVSSSNRGFQRQAVTVQTDENGNPYIASGFTYEEDCLFQFTGITSGAIVHGDYSVDLPNSRYTTGIASQTLNFRSNSSGGVGAHRIQYTSGWTTYYLRYTSSWSRGSSTSNANVYLFKLVEYQISYNVNFDRNGATSGQLPDNAENWDADIPYTIPEPKEELRKDIGDDTWLFLGWNSLPDGSGIEYKPGDTITLTEDITLYADWYPQTKYTVTMITDLDDVRTDVEDISGQNRTFAVLLNGGDGTFIPLKRTEEGTYSAKVAENGDYIVYARVDDGEYEPVHGHKVTIYNQDGATECQHFSVNYHTQGGVWAEGEDPGRQFHHAMEDVPVTDKLPALEGNRFLGWLDDEGNHYEPGSTIRGIQKQVNLYAQWEKTVSVRVDVVINHAADGGADMEENNEVTFVVMRTDELGLSQPVGTVTLSKDNCGDYVFTQDFDNHQTCYTLPADKATFTDLRKGVYTVYASKSQYTVDIASQTDSEGNVDIVVTLQFNPDSFDLDFDVVVEDWEDIPESLRPASVNLRVTCWRYDGEKMDWMTITQQEGSNPPTNVVIDPSTGKGHGFFPVWKHWPSNDGEIYSYVYRIRVSSYVMPDGSLHAPSVENHTEYTAGIYSGTVSILPEGFAPDFPPDSVTDLRGTRYDDDKQMQDSTPTLTMRVTPFTVTFDAGEGTVNEDAQLQIKNQFLYPDLNSYVAVPQGNLTFAGWVDEKGQPAENLAGQLLTSNVTYFARYSDGMTLTGDVAVATTYQDGNSTVQVREADLPKQVMVLVRKQVGGLFVTVDSQLVSITYDKSAVSGTGSYEFVNLPNDGTGYQVHILPVNFTATYDNDLDGSYAADEELVLLGSGTDKARLNVQLTFAPETYLQYVGVDASQIAKNFRPTAALTTIVSRDLGNIHPYTTIAQHTVAPFGIEMQLDDLGRGVGSDEVWVRHVDGTYYEYQTELSKLYGNVAGAYTSEGTPYTENSPYTVVYGPPTNYLNQSGTEKDALIATIVPKEYSVVLDLNLEGDTDTPVLGLDKYITDDGTGNLSYAYNHTWSYASSFEAYPYREGYVFVEWEEADSEQGDNNLVVSGGQVNVGATLDKNVILKAKWTPLTGTDYTVRHLELNTDKVLHGAQAITGAAAGTQVVAAVATLPLDGYVYAGAMVDGEYIDKDANPAMTVTNDPKQNLLVIYYLPDASSGFTEQVEGNVDINKTAKLESNGTYTITLDTHTKDNPITTMIRQDTPMDIVLVLDQSGSLAANNYEYLNALEEAVDSFVESVADHGRRHEVDHRIAIVGFAGNATDGHSSDPVKATGGKESDSWINTGVFDSNGEYHLYNVNGFNYTKLTDTSTMTADGIYYTKVTVDGQDRYLLLTHHTEYRHLITEEQARVAELQGEQVYGYAYNEQNVGGFVELTRNSSGLWLYGNKQLYSQKEFFTYHTDVWTHRDGLEAREIHAYGVGTAYTSADHHTGVYTREETTGDSFEQSIYHDALIPVSVGAAGSGGTNPGLLKATQSLGADGATRASCGMEMANEVLKAHPLAEGEERARLVVMFTDGEPGYLGFDTDDDGYYQQAVTEANNAIEQSYIAKNTYKAHVYTIGLYESAGVEATSDVAYYMNALSSNYPNAHSMDDIKASYTYEQAADGTKLENNGKFFVLYNGTYYPVKYGNVWVSGSFWFRNCWYYTRSGTNYSITETANPVVSGGKVGNQTIYWQSGGYIDTDKNGYYATTESSDYLKEYFENVLRDITTKITTEIVLHKDTILRDIMGQGLVLTPNTVVTAYKEKGVMENGKIVWSGNLEEVASVEIPDTMPAKLGSEETVTMSYTLDDGTEVVKESVPYIQIYNLNAENPTNPNGQNYHPHTIDITGYDFDKWYISEGHPEGYKMVVTITQVEARDDVVWGRSTHTNNDQSGLWLPADERGNRELLLAFDQPDTIFVERAYVMDYGKSFNLSGWYFDDEDGKDATPMHLDFDITDGMNGFETPVTASGAEDIPYGNVKLENGVVTYSPTSMNWGGFDQFYVFGQTWRKTVLAQDANANGVEDENLANLWNKVTVIPANNIYYEDSFVTDPENGIEGFTFTGAWSVVGDSANDTEDPEHLESKPYGEVHGWTDSLADDKNFTDGSAHVAFKDGYDHKKGARVEFSFTGTGVEVYSRTNAQSGWIVAFLYEKSGDKLIYKQSLLVDDLAVSGDYYHIPTVSFGKLPYGTYSLMLVATEAVNANGSSRAQYYIDGVRVLNPLGNASNYQNGIVKEAYGLESNAVFTEVRDILIDNGSFNADKDDFEGAVFIDQLKKGQAGAEQDAAKVTTYDVGVFEAYGPKNEVYLSSGQAIVLKVEEGNTYYVGLKSLKGGKVTANLSGIEDADPTAIEIGHTTDLYYRVTPVDGYIVIQNGSEGEEILSITNLRTTNLTAPAPNGGVLRLAKAEAVAVMDEFTDYLLNKPEEPVLPEEEPVDENQQMTDALFTSVRQWIVTD